MVLLTIAVVAGVSAVVAGLVSGGLEEPASPIPVRALPDGPLTGQDVTDLRFAQAFRGYRMDQVDAAMDSLAAELDRLRALLPEEGGPPDPGPGSGAEAPDRGPDHGSYRPNDGHDRGDEGGHARGNSVVAAETWPAGWPAGRD
jgi:DivIVA domain-containing protein